MPVFKYSAKNIQGKDVVGEVEAVSDRAAAALLKKRGYMVLNIEPYRGKFFLLEMLGSLKKPSLNDLVNFTNQLSVMLSAGLHLGQALEILTLQSSSSAMRSIIGSISRDVEGGFALSYGLSRFPKIFGKTYISLVKAGEASGGLDKILIKLSSELEKQRELRGKIKGALVYPVILSIAMVGVVILIMVFVIPKLTQMYTSLNVELPLPTKILIGISDFIVTKWYILIIVVAGLVLGFRAFKKTPKGAYILARLSFKMPVFGNLLRQKDMAEFSRTLSLLVTSGVPIVDALKIVGDALSNLILRKSTASAAEYVQKGMTLSDSILKGGNFPPLVSQMINVGEETGRVDEVLFKVAAYYEMEVDRVVKNLSTALEPLIMLVLGAVVGLLIISIITPIYKLTSSF